VALIPAFLAFIQTLVYSVGWLWCIAWCACLPSSFIWHSSCLSTEDGWTELIWVAGNIPKWFTGLPTASHPSKY